MDKKNEVVHLVEYRFVLDRVTMDPGPLVDFLRTSVSRLGYNPVVEAAYGGDDTFQGIDVKVAEPISDAHLADLKTRGFVLRGEEKGVEHSPGHDYYASFV